MKPKQGHLVLSVVNVLSVVEELFEDSMTRIDAFGDRITDTFEKGSTVNWLSHPPKGMEEMLRAMAAGVPFYPSERQALVLEASDLLNGNDVNHVTLEAFLAAVDRARDEIQETTITRYVYHGMAFDTLEGARRAKLVFLVKDTTNGAKGFAETLEALIGLDRAIEFMEGLKK